MSDDLVKRLRDLGDHAAFEPHMHHTAADRIEELEARLKKAIEIADELAYAHGKWIEEDIDYEEFYSWREDLN